MPNLSQKTNVKRIEQQIAKAKNSFKKADLMLDLALLIKHSDAQQAISLAKQALEISTQLSYEHGKALAQYMLAQFYSALVGDYKVALHYAKQSLELFTTLDSPLYITRVIRTIGKIYLGLGNFEVAEDYLVQSHKLSLEYNDSKEIASAELSLGNFYDDLNRYPEAIEHFSNALKLDRQVGDAVGESIVLNNLGNIYSTLGDFSKAMHYHNESLQIKRSLNDQHGISASLNNISGIYLGFGDYEKALDYMLQSLAIKRTQGNIEGSANTLSNIGMVQVEIGNPKAALESFTEALHLYSQLGQKRQMALGMNHIGVAKIKLGLYKQGLAWLHKALKIRKELKDEYGLASSYCNLGEALRIVGDYQQAIEYGILGSDISNNLGDIERLGHHYNCLSESYIAGVRYNEAIEYAEKGYEIAMRSNDIKQQAGALHLLATASEQTGELQKSIDFYKKFIQMRQQLQDHQTANKVQTMLVEFGVERMQTQAEITRLKSEQLERELTLKNKELTTLALHLVNKNEFLKTIGDQISEDVTNTSQVIKNLSKMVQDGANSEHEWKLFEKQFVQINPDFGTRLEEASGGALTPTELKICSLLRTGLNSQEVANVLFLSKRTVENHRYNIHRKLNLGEQKLIPYLMKL